MKRQIYLLIWVFNYTASAQSFPVHNANSDYVVADVEVSSYSKKEFRDIERDNTGLYWFQTLTGIYSFDGINWKTYPLVSAIGKSITFRINELEILSDGTILLATEDGMYMFDRLIEKFIPVQQRFPSLNLPISISCFYQVAGKLVFTSQNQEGFYLLDWNNKNLRIVIIDSVTKALVPGGEVVAITSDKDDNLWGITADRIGLWKYDLRSGKISCSWRGDFPGISPGRFKNLYSINFAKNENSLWLSHGLKGYLEKFDLKTGRSSFFSFFDNLKVRKDTMQKKRYPVYFLKADVDDHLWVTVSDKYLVKLDSAIQKMSYVSNESNVLPIGDLQWFRPEKKKVTGLNNNPVLLWVRSTEKMSVINRRERSIKHILFDSLNKAGIVAADYENEDNRKNIFLQSYKNNYLLTQQNEGRPKLICFDSNLKIKGALFNNELKQYPAYFRQEPERDSLYFAFMRQGMEPLDFRKVIIKEFVVDLEKFTSKEVVLDFTQRVWRYGSRDRNNIYWLFSNGFLYSFDPVKNRLDSIFIAQPAAKGFYPLELVKGFDYPTTLHSPSSTFWIDFIPTRELYKVNLHTKKVEKIFNCCINNNKCSIPGNVVDIYNFDDQRVFLQLSYTSILINAFNDSLETLTDLFQDRLTPQTQNGSGLYGNWLATVLPYSVNFLNIHSGQQKELNYGENFKWKLSQFNSKPVVNEKGEMVLMSATKGNFIMFNIDSVPIADKPGGVHFSFIRVDNANLGLDSLLKKNKLKLKFNRYNNIQIGFSNFSLLHPGKVNYEYALFTGSDTVWSRINGKPELTLSELAPGDHQLLIRASNSFGEYSDTATALTIEIDPLFRQTWWFKSLAILFIAGIFYLLYQYRLKQLSRLQVIRNNIARDLHDDIGSTLNSISIYSEVARQQAGKNIPALDLIGLNSRKIIESMSDIVWTINPENDSFEKVIDRMRSFAHQLLSAKKVEYTFEADEKLNSLSLPMLVRKNFYLVFKEAINNLVKYSQADKVSIVLFENNKMICLKINDNGIGIPDNPETQGNGLLSMKKRAGEIKAKLEINSVQGKGTGIELQMAIKRQNSKLTS